MHCIETSFIVYRFTKVPCEIYILQNCTDPDILIVIIKHYEMQRVNYFHFALWQLLSESIVYIVIKEHYANCYCWTSFKKLSWYTVKNCKHSVCTRTCKSLPTFDAKIYYVQIRCYMVTICRKRNDKIVYEIKKYTGNRMRM